MTTIFDSCKLRINGITHVCLVEVPELLNKSRQLNGTCLCMLKPQTR